MAHSSSAVSNSPASTAPTFGAGFSGAGGDVAAAAGSAACGSAVCGSTGASVRWKRTAAPVTASPFADEPGPCAPGGTTDSACARMGVGPRDVGGLRHVLDATRSWMVVGRIDLARVDAVLDHPQRQVVLTLFAQDAAEQLDVVRVELAVPRRRAFRIDQTLALEEPDLRDGDIRELLEQEREHLPDRQVTAERGGLPGHRRRRGRHGIRHRAVRRTPDGTCRSGVRRRDGAASCRCAPGSRRCR